MPLADEKDLIASLAKARALAAAAPMTLGRALELAAWMEKTPDGIVTTTVAKDVILFLTTILRPVSAVVAEDTEKLGLSNTAMNAEYWSKAARETGDSAEALLCMEQARNAWRNAAYTMARRLHAMTQPAAEPSKTDG